MKEQTRITEKTEKTDEQLLVLAQQGDETSETILLEKYKPLVRSRARELFLAGGDHDDLLQEGMLGLFKAIRSYDSARGISFGAYARVLISRQIGRAILAAQRQKHHPLNQSVSLTEIEERQGDGVLGTAASPETILLELENTRELRAQIDALLSPMERKVLEQYLLGYDYLQIAEAMKKPTKSIDNALQRIRRKVAALLFA